MVKALVKTVIKHSKLSIKRRRTVLFKGKNEEGEREK